MARQQDLMAAILATASIALVALFFMLPALLDFYQGKEPDLSGEWTVVVVAYVSMTCQVC